MAWTTPATVIAGQLMTAAFWNTQVRDDLAFLFSSAPRASEFNAGNSGAAITIDFATNGPVQRVTRNAATAITLTAPSVPSTVVLRLIHDGTAGSYTVTFSTSVKWGNGVIPTWTLAVANAVDIVTLLWDGSAWWGAAQVAMA